MIFLNCDTRGNLSDTKYQCAPIVIFSNYLNEYSLDKSKANKYNQSSNEMQTNTDQTLSIQTDQHHVLSSISVR